MNRFDVMAILFLVLAVISLATESDPAITIGAIIMCKLNLIEQRVARMSG